MTADIDTTGTMKQRYIAFTMGSEKYAIPLLQVKEVLAVPDVTPLPYAPPHFLGIINLRGQIISLIDLRVKLGIKAEKTAETSVIICDLKPYCLGVVVSSVDSVFVSDDQGIQKLPESNQLKNSRFIQGVIQRTEELVVILDLAQTLDLADYKVISGETQKSKSA